MQSYFYFQCCRMAYTKNALLIKKNYETKQLCINVQPATYGGKMREKNTLPDFLGVKTSGTSDKIKTNGWPAYLSQYFMFPETNYQFTLALPETQSRRWK